MSEGQEISKDGGMKTPEIMEDVSMPDAFNSSSRTKREARSIRKGHEITTATIKKPMWSYACLELVTEPPSEVILDDLTVKSYLTAALTQFLGITGASISIDILKTDGKQAWIRIPQEDASAVVAAVGGWIGGNETDGSRSWKVKASGNWLGSLVARMEVEKVWSG